MPAVKPRLSPLVLLLYITSPVGQEHLSFRKHLKLLSLSGTLPLSTMDQIKQNNIINRKTKAENTAACQGVRKSHYPSTETKSEHSTDKIQSNSIHSLLLPTQYAACTQTQIKAMRLNTVHTFKQLVSNICELSSH
jgi:hypothetical protein